MKVSSIFILALVSIQLKAQPNFEARFNQGFSSSQLQEDLHILRTGLEKIHPGLYRYTEKDVLDSQFDKMQKNLNADLTYQEFYREVCTLIAQIKCQHTIAIPDQAFLNEIVKSGRFFPFGIFWEFDPLKAYVSVDLSGESNLTPGTRLLGINNQSIESLYQELISYFPSDGEILTNKYSRLQVGPEFMVWYYLLKAQPEVFELELEDRSGRTFTKTYLPVTFKDWVKNYKKHRFHKDPKIKAYMSFYIKRDKLNSKKPIRHEFLNENTALLKVSNFDHHKFDQSIADAFGDLQRKGCQNLIIDLRYNGGGSDILGRHLFSYLINEPTKYFDSLYSSAGISDTTFLFRHTDKNLEWFEYVLPLVTKMENGRFATKPEVNEGLKLQQPSENSFKGNVYVLMNGRSASTTSEFTAALHFNKRATFIGEESGGAYHGGHGGDFANLELPNTKITVQIPLTKYVMNSEETRFIGQGTPPDHTVPTTMQDILNLTDPQLDFALMLIKNNRQ